ncbi:MAG TPA: SGNH/GDSL hydrolase family protein [Rhizomicrobium sp.]
MTIDRRTLLSVGLAASFARVRASEAQPLAQPSVSPEEQRLHTDWAYLARYRNDNARVQALPAQARRVVFIGDSITQGWIDFHPEFFAANGFIDRGISGQTTPQMLARFRQDVISLAPAAVHILAGTNDVAENTGPFDAEATRSNFQSMAELARLHGIGVILGAVPPAADFYWRRGLGPIPKIRAMNEWMRGYAAANRFAFADYTSLLDDGNGAMRPGLSYDGVRPTKAGYLVMEHITLPAVASALA